MCNSKEIPNDMKRYLTTLFIAFVSVTANMAVAQQEGIQPKDTVKLQIVNELVTNEDGQTSNKVILKSKDERLFVKWVEEDTVYNVYTADTIVQLVAVPVQKEILVIRGANAKESGVSCFYSDNGTPPLSEDNGYSHYLCGLFENKQSKVIDLTKRVTILRLSQNTHPDGIELKFAQERGNWVKARLWSVKPWSKDPHSLPVNVYLKQNNYNSPSSLIEDSIFTFATTDTLESFSIKWNTENNFFSPTLKIDDKLCELERQDNHCVLKGNLDSLLRNKGLHMLKFECKLFVSDKGGFKFEPYSIEFKIERNDSNEPSWWDKIKHLAHSNWLLFLFILMFVAFASWIYRETLIKHCKTPKFIKSLNKLWNSSGFSKERDENDIPGTEDQGVTSDESHSGEDKAKGSDSEGNSLATQKQVAHFDIDMKKEELLKQLQILVDVIEKPEETLKTNVVSKFLDKYIFKHYTQNRIKQQEKTKVLNCQLSNLYKALEYGLVDKDEFNGLKKDIDNLKEINKELERRWKAARKAAESLYKEQLLFLLERLYANYVCKSSNNERLKTLVALFDKEIDSSNPTDLAGRFNQKLINVLLTEIELCFISVNKKADWCNKYGITYSTGESLDVFVNDIYNKGFEKGRTAAEPEIEKRKKENEELTQENKQLHSAIDKLEKQVSGLEEKLKKALEELTNRPVIPVPVLPEEFEKEKAELIKTHKKEVETLNETITGLEATITELKKKHKEEISALETKHKEEVNKLKNAHKEQLAAIDIKYKREIDNLNEAYKKEVETLNETITGFGATITELKKKHTEEINALETKHKEEINKLKNAHKEQLAAFDAKHKREIDNLNEAHKKEVETLNETITGLDSTIIELKNKHKEEISDIETKHEEKLGALKAEHTQAIDKIKQSHAEEVKIHVAKPNRWCNNFITEVRQMLDDLGQELHNLQISVDGGSSSDRTIFVTAINEMVQFFGVFEANVNKLCDEKGNQDDLDLPAIRESLLTMFNKVLSYSGSWANRLFLLESYSRVPQLAGQMQSRGVDVATLERAAATAKALFAKSGISVVEPAVLAAPFKTDNYDFENTEVLIYRFFPEVSPQDYSGRVFDLVRVGYNVVRGEHKNPVVVYF